jgi:hypothetical protein
MVLRTSGRFHLDLVGARPISGLRITPRPQGLGPIWLGVNR